MSATAENNKQLAETLNDLVKIHHDRIEGYNKAADQVGKESVDLIALFKSKVAESENMVVWLKQQILALGGEYSNDTTVSGKIFRAWMDVKNTFKPESRGSILDSCVFGEEAALKAYDIALNSDAEMDANTRQELMKHISDIRSSHDAIKKYSEMHKN